MHDGKIAKMQGCKDAALDAYHPELCICVCMHVCAWVHIHAEGRHRELNVALNTGLSYMTGLDFFFFIFFFRCWEFHVHP